MNFFRRYPEMRKCVVNLKSGTSFHALVWGHAHAYVILRDVEMIQDRGDNIGQKTVEGEVAVLQADIDFIQVLG